MPCTEIKVYQLSPEAQARLGGLTEVLLDIPAEFSIRLSKDVERLSIANRISTEGALGFSVPFSQNNDAVFLDFQNPLVLDNRVNFYTVSVRVGDHAIRFDRLLVKGKDEKGKTWELELRRSPDHWIELASQVTIDQLDYGSFSMDRTAIIANWSQPVYNGNYKTPNIGQRPYYWPVIDFGGWCDLTEPPQGTQNRVKALAVEDFRPLLSLPYIVRAGFCKIGWTLDGVIFDTDWFKRLWVYALRPDYYIAGKRGGRFTARRFARKRWENSPGDYLTVDEVSEAVVAWRLSGSAGTLAGIHNITDVALKFRFQLQGEFHNDRPLPYTLFLGVFEVGDTEDFFTGEVISTEMLQVDFAAGEKKMVIFDQEVILQRGQRGALHTAVTPDVDGFYIEPGLHVKITPANQSLMTDDFPVVSECVSDQTTVLDWLKAVVHLINGRLETDYETKTVTIYPNRKADAFGEVVPGFLLDEEPATDISELIVANSIQAKPVRPDLKRYTLLSFAKSTDAYINSLNLTTPAHARKLLNGLDLPNQVEADENPILEPTLEGIPSGLASGSGGRNPLPYLPRLWDNTDGQRSFNIGPRILYAYGDIKQINPEPITAVNTYTSLFFDHEPNPSNTGLVTTFGYATQLPTWEISPTPAVKGSVVFGIEEKDLFVSYYLGYTQDARNGTLLDLLLFMRMKDYIGYDFRRFFTFKYNGIPLRVPMVAIRDFATCSEIPTPVTFFVSPAETECCDRPCGCQFSTCDYYQDLGPYMRQSTLNDMQLVSFVVDGIELVSSPINFGTIKIVNVGEMQYVTNLIDTLNSVGAPYFSFGISTRTHPEKGKRFFSLKRPSCTPFKIVVNYQGSEVYLYTQDEQKTKWFSGGTWEDFGYGSEFYGAPIDCKLTKEY